MVKPMDLGALIVRVVLGVTFFLHGLVKFQGGIQNTAAFFEKIGMPGILATVVGSIELIGGICLILGLGVRLFGALFSVIMLGVILTVKSSKGLVGGFELELALFAMSLQLLINGNGWFSIDGWFRSRRNTQTTGA